jgi:hypothetical protein
MRGPLRQGWSDHDRVTNGPSLPALVVQAPVDSLGASRSQAVVGPAEWLALKEALLR